MFTLALALNLALLVGPPPPQLEVQWLWQPRFVIPWEEAVVDTMRLPDGQTWVALGSKGGVAAFEADGRKRWHRRNDEHGKKLALTDKGDVLVQMGSGWRGYSVDKGLTKRLPMDTKVVAPPQPTGVRAAPRLGDGTGRMFIFGKRPKVAYEGGHDATVTAVALSPKGGLAASGDAAGVIHLWELPSGTRVRSLEPVKGAVKDLAFSPEGTRLAMAGGLRAFAIYEVRTGKRTAHWRAPDKPLVARAEHGHPRAIAWVDDQTVSTLRGRSLHAFRKASSLKEIAGRHEHQRPLIHHTKAPFGPGEGPNEGRFLATGPGERLIGLALPDGRIHRLDGETGDDLHTIETGRTPSGLAVAFSGADPKAPRLVMATDDGWLRMYGAMEGRSLHRAWISKRAVTAVAAAGHVLIAGAADGGVVLVRLP